MCEVIDVEETNDPCNPNGGGNEDVLYYALLSDFVSIPLPPVSQTVLREKFIITTAPVFKAGKYWKSIEAKANSVNSNYEPAGTSGMKGGKLAFAISANNPNGPALFNISDGNTPYVFLTKPNSLPEGQYEIIGSFKHKATMTATKAGGTPEGDAAMFNFEAKSTQKFLVLYTGTVQTAPSV